LTVKIPIARSWRARLSKAVLAGALVVAAPAAGQTAGQEHKVIMRNMDYGPVPSGLKVGDTIVWINNDTVQHSATARDHSFDIRLNPGQSAKMPLAKAGNIAFYCLFHPSMHGTLNVAAK
jgi:plastocyanin